MPKHLPCLYHRSIKRWIAAQGLGVGAVNALRAFRCLWNITQSRVLFAILLFDSEMFWEEHMVEPSMYQYR